MADTKYYKIDVNDSKSENLPELSDTIKDGGIIVVPSKSVYAIVAHAMNENAISKIFEAKKRPVRNPLVVQIADMSSLVALAKYVPQEAYSLAKKFWPGPLTMILPKSELVPDSITCGLSSIAICMPDNPLLMGMLKNVYSPVATSSANIAGTPCSTTFQHAKDDFGGRVDAIIDGGSCKMGIEPTVISLTGKVPRLIRPGLITLNELEAVIGRIEVDRMVMSKLKRTSMVGTPGVLNKKYAPKTKLVVMKGTTERFCYRVNSADKNVGALCFNEDIKYLEKPFVTYGPYNQPDLQAFKIFDALREVDRLGVDVVYIHCPSSMGMGLAVYNRVIYAADFNLVKA